MVLLAFALECVGVHCAHLQREVDPRAQRHTRERLLRILEATAQASMELEGSKAEVRAGVGGQRRAHNFGGCSFECGEQWVSPAFA